MRIAEEIDALDSLAIRPIPYLVTTRLMASVVAVVPLYVACLAVSYLTTQVVVYVISGGSTGSYLHYFALMLSGQDILYSLIKTIIFVWIASTVQCYYGFYAIRRSGGRGSGCRACDEGQHHRRDHGQHAADDGAVVRRRRRKVRGMSANSLDPDGRGPSNRQLLGCGVALLVVAALVTATLLVKSTGRLDPYVRVVADLVNVGDGLPQRSDVKYHGVLVGVVDSVTPAADGNPNFVHIDLNPEYAQSIPAGVTARVVPSNVFAVSSVQLVDQGPGAAIRAGAHIPEDTELPTVLFQTTISKLRDMLAATGRGREDKTVGILAAVNAATEGRADRIAGLGCAIEPADRSARLDRGHRSRCDDGFRAHRRDAAACRRRHRSLSTRCIRRWSRCRPSSSRAPSSTALISGGVHTMGTTHTALNNHADRLVKITGELTPVIGVPRARPRTTCVPAFVKLNTLSDKFFEQVWIADRDIGNMRVNLSFTPTLHLQPGGLPAVRRA